MRNTKTKLMIVMCAAMAVMAVGYAAFSTVLNITGTASITSDWKVVFSNIKQESITSGVTIKAEPKAIGTSATFNVGLTSPGDKIVYKITLANQGGLDAIVKDIQASATDSPAIIFSVTGIDIGYELKQQTSKDFYVTIQYDPNVTTQPDKLQKKLTVNIITEQKLNQSVIPGTPIVDQPLYLSASILRDNVAYADNVASPNVTSSTGIDFSKPLINSYEDKRGETEESKILDNNSWCQYSTDYTFNSSDGIYTLTGTAGSGGCGSIYGDSTEYKYVCTIQGLCDEIYEITGYTDATTATGYVRKSEASSTIDNGQGLYYTSTNTEDNKTTYYFRGNVQNNYVKFGQDANGNDILWRIVRINEDGSVRLITENTIGTSTFNENYDDNAYVGYMYGTPDSDSYTATHMNKNNSTIKDVIDDWYLNKSDLSSYTHLMSIDAGFCNDRSLSTSGGNTENSGFGENFTLYKIQDRRNSPQFACPQSNDLFTLNISNKGNQSLTNPIGLLTADEARYAGYISNATSSSIDNESIYITNDDFWTMTPSVFQSYRTLDFVTTNNLLYVGSTTSLGVRPVINLKGAVEISTELPSGCTRLDGTEACPYIIK